MRAVVWTGCLQDWVSWMSTQWPAQAYTTGCRNRYVPPSWSLGCAALMLKRFYMRLQSITVSVSDVPSPDDSDAIAFLVPYSADRSVTAPQKFQWCYKGSSGPDYLKTGTTSVTCASH